VLSDRISGEKKFRPLSMIDSMSEEKEEGPGTQSHLLRWGHFLPAAVRQRLLAIKWNGYGQCPKIDCAPVPSREALHKWALNPLMREVMAMFVLGDLGLGRKEAARFLRQCDSAAGATPTDLATRLHAFTVASGVAVLRPELRTRFPKPIPFVKPNAKLKGKVQNMMRATKFDHHLVSKAQEARDLEVGIVRVLLDTSCFVCP
jgi:hypothetical protein